MQKRLLALVATVAMVLSMFAGVAFAVPKDENWDTATSGKFLSVEWDETSQTLSVYGDYDLIPEKENPDGTSARWIALQFDKPASLKGTALEQPLCNGREPAYTDPNGAYVWSYLAAYEEGRAFDYYIEWSDNAEDDEKFTVEYINTKLHIETDYDAGTYTYTAWVTENGKKANIANYAFDGADGLEISRYYNTVTFTKEEAAESATKTLVAKRGAQQVSKAEYSFEKQSAYKATVDTKEGVVYGDKVVVDDTTTWNAIVTGTIIAPNGKAPSNQEFAAISAKAGDDDVDLTVISYDDVTGEFKLALADVASADSNKQSKDIVLSWGEVKADSFAIAEEPEEPAETVLKIDPSPIVVDKNANGKLDVTIKGTLKTDGKPLSFGDFWKSTFEVNDKAVEAKGYDVATGEFTLAEIKDVDPGTKLVVVWTFDTVEKKDTVIAKATPAVVKDLKMKIDGVKDGKLEGKHLGYDDLEVVVKGQILKDGKALSPVEFYQGSFNYGIKMTDVSYVDGQFQFKLECEHQDFITLRWIGDGQQATADPFMVVKAGTQDVQPAKITFDKDYFVASGEKKDVVSITGQITGMKDGEDTGKLIDGRVVLELYGPNGFSHAVYVYDGVIDIELNGDLNEGKYWAHIDSTKFAAEAAAFSIVRGDVISDDELTFKWSDEGVFSYEGILPLNVKTNYIRLIDANDKLVWSTDTNRRTFSFSIPKANFTTPGVIRLQYQAANGSFATFAVGEITPANISSKLVLDPDSVIYGLDEVINLSVEDADKLYLPGNDVKWEYKLLGKTKNTKTASIPYSFTSADYGAKTASLVITVNGQEAYKASKTLTVQMPGHTNVLGIPEEVTVAEGLPLKNLRVFYQNDKGELALATIVKIVAEGPGIVKGEVKPSDTLTPNHAGVITLTIYAKDRLGNQFTVPVEVKVTGASMTIEPAKVELKTASTVVVTLKDEDDKPINNADIKFYNGDTLVATYKAADLNPNNGVYEIELKADSKLVANAADLDVKIFVGDVPVARGKFAVLGKNVYDVETDLAKDVLAGQKTKVKVSVKKDDKVVYPNEFVVYDAEGKQVGGSRGYTKDGEKCVINLTLAKDGEYTLVARNKDLSEIGSTTFNVVKPVVELSVDKLTNNVESAFTVKLVDPTDDNKALKWNIKVSPEYAQLLGLELNGKKVATIGTPNLGKAEEYELVALLNADYKAAEKAEEVAGLKFVVVGDGTVEIDAVMPIADAELIADPAEPVYGQTGSLTLKLVDANEAPLAGYKVFRGETEVGVTDENGEVSYRGRMTDSMTFKANLDATVDKKVQTVQVTVVPVDDQEAPVLGEIPEKTDKATFELVITDNVKVTKVYIDGEEQLFVPGAEVKIPLNLKLGKNTFRVMALDAADNGIDETITIVYAPAGVKLTIGKTEYVANGETKTMEAAPYLKGDHTMIPVRALETFGVKYAWDQDTKTATFELDENVVKVTVGSTTAVVNGEQAAVPVAPEIVNNRTMAPLRFVLQNLGLKVHWVPGGEITITR